MKKLLIIFLVLFIPGLCFSGPLQQAHKKVIAGQTVASGGDCSSQTTEIDQDVTDTSNSNFYDARQEFQSWTAPKSGTIYGFEMGVTLAQGSTTHSLRFGTSTDLSGASPTLTGNVAVGDALQWVTFTFAADDRPVVTNTTVYYIARQPDSDSYSDRCSLPFEDGDNEYTGGGRGYDSSSTDWTLADSISTVDDSVFKVIYCD